MKLFKNYFLLGLLTLGLLTSCSSDDDSESSSVVVTEADLEGIWNLTGYRTENARSVVDFSNLPDLPSIPGVGSTFVTEFSNVGSNFDYTAEFSTGPNVISGEGSYDITTSTNVNGDQLEDITTNFDSDDLESGIPAGEWQLVEGGTAIRSTVEEMSNTMSIIDFSENRLVLSINLAESNGITLGGDTEGSFGGGALNIEGVSSEVSGSVIITLTR